MTIKLPRLSTSIDVDGACFRLSHNADDTTLTELRNKIEAEVSGTQIAYLAQFDIIKDGMFGLVPELFQQRFTKSFASISGDRIKELDEEGKFTGERRTKKIDQDEEKNLKEIYKDRIKEYEKANEELKEKFYIAGEITARFTGYDDIAKVLEPEVSGIDLHTLAEMYVYNRELKPDYTEITVPATILDPERKDEYKAEQEKLAARFGYSEYVNAKKELREASPYEVIKVMGRLTGVKPGEKAINTYLELMSESFITHLENKVG